MVIYDANNCRKFINKIKSINNRMYHRQSNQSMQSVKHPLNKIYSQSIIHENESSS